MSAIVAGCGSVFEAPVKWWRFSERVGGSSVNTMCGVWLRCRLGAVYRMWGLVCWVVSFPPLSIMFELDAAGWRVLGVVSHEWFSLFWLVTVVGCSRFLCSAFLG